MLSSCTPEVDEQGLSTGYEEYFLGLKENSSGLGQLSKKLCQYCVNMDVSRKTWQRLEYHER